MTAGPISEDFLALGPLLIARLKSEIPNRTALGAAELNKLFERDITAGGIHVIYHGIKGIMALGDYISKIEQLWMVVIGARTLRSEMEGWHDAGMLLASVGNALQGWKPAPGWSSMRMEVPPSNLNFEDGMSYYPLLFSITAYINPD